MSEKYLAGGNSNRLRRKRQMALVSHSKSDPKMEPNYSNS